MNIDVFLYWFWLLLCLKYGLVWLKLCEFESFYLQDDSGHLQVVYKSNTKSNVYRLDEAPYLDEYNYQMKRWHFLDPLIIHQK